MLANSEFVALLKQANTDSSKMAEVIGVSEAQLRFVTNTCLLYTSRFSMQDEAEQKAKIDREQANELEYVDESQKDVYKRQVYPSSYQSETK